MGNPSNGHRKMELKKGPWTRDEDQKLLAYIQEHGHGSWRGLPAKAGLQRCGKSCRLRWTNYLRPDIKRGKFSLQEEKAIIRLHALLGNRWSAIAAHLPKRTDNEIKNYWNTRLKKRLARMGIDPITHKPKSGPNGPVQSRQAAVVSHMAQWETARLEAEARLVRESKIMSKIQHLRRTNPPQTLTPQQAAPPPCLDVLRVWQASTSHNDFFSSTRSLESPTSTLNLSVDSRPVTLVVENDVVSGNSAGACGDAAESRFEKSVEMMQDNSTTSYSYGGLDGSDSFELDPTTDFNFVCNDYLGDFDESRNYWNNLLSSPMGSPVF